MPSPFPGMDPYLEGDLWTTLHHALAAEIIRQLGPKLRPRYVALAEKRFVTEEREEISATYPDVSVMPSDSLGEMSVASKPCLRVTTVLEEEVPHVSVEIRAVADRELVTAIEILSPTNKTSRGYVQYLGRRQRFLHSEAHLLEIDLLRRGNRVPMKRPLPKEPYFVFLSRAELRPMTEVWPVALDEALPTVPVPLAEGDPDVGLDLQDAFTQTYEISSYDLIIDYSRPPDVPFTQEEEKKAERILAQASR